MWTFLLAPVAFPILGADFLSNFKLLVDISNKRLVAHSGKLIQLEQGKRAKTVVVTEMVAAAPPPAVAPSSPSRPTVEALPSTPSLEAPSSSSLKWHAANWHAGAARSRHWKLKTAASVVAAAPPMEAPSSPSHPGEAPSSGPTGQLAASRHVGVAKKLLLKYKAVVGASKRLPPVKHAVEHLIETTATRLMASRYTDWTQSGWPPHS